MHAVHDVVNQEGQVQHRLDRTVPAGPGPQAAQVDEFGAGDVVVVDLDAGSLACRLVEWEKRSNEQRAGRLVVPAGTAPQAGMVQVRVFATAVSGPPQ